MDSDQTEINTVNTFDLSNVETFRRLQRYVTTVVELDLVPEAYTLIRGLVNALKQYPAITEHPTELSQGYENILNLGRAIALPLLPEDEIQDFFRKGIASILRNPDANLTEKINAKLVSIMFLEDRDEFKKKLRFDLHQNFERLTLQSVRTSTGAAAPTVKQWLENAEKIQTGNLPLSVAILQDESFKRLNQNEQEVVLAVMAIDDTLSLSSLDPEGNEQNFSLVDENGQHVVIRAGAIEPAFTKSEDDLLKPYIQAGSTPLVTAVPVSTQPKKPTRTAKEYFQLIQELNAKHSADDEARYDQQEALLQKVGMDVKAVVKALHDALLVSDGQTALAALSVLARSGAMAVALEDDSIREAFELEFLAPLAKDNNVNLAVAKDYLKAHPTDTQSIEAFLAWALTRSLNGDKVESARVGNQLENTLAALGSPDFIGMTYFDVTAGHFKWTLFTMQPDGRITW